MYMNTSFNPIDMIFYTGEEGKVMSGGFSVESLILKNGGSPMITNNLDLNLNGLNVGGGTSDKSVKNISSLFKNMSIPSGLLYQINNEKKRKFFHHNEDNANEDNVNKNRDKSVLPEDIHSILIKMIEVDNNKIKHERKSRKPKKSIKNNSKKNSKKI